MTTDRPTDDLPARLEGIADVFFEFHEDDQADVLAAAARIRELEQWKVDLKRSRLDIIHVKEESILDRDRQIARLTDLGNALADAARPTIKGYSRLSMAIAAWDNR